MAGRKSNSSGLVLVSVGFAIRFLKGLSDGRLDDGEFSLLGGVC